MTSKGFKNIVWRDIELCSVVLFNNYYDYDYELEISRRYYTTMRLLCTFSLVVARDLLEDKMHRLRH